MIEVIVERPSTGILTACGLVNVSRRTMYNRIAKGKVEYYRIPSGSIRIYID